MIPRSGPTDRGILQGLRILVVEDELLLALEMQTLIERAGGIVIGPAPRVPAALALVQREKLDGAILDVNLAGTLAFEIADALATQETPFIFVTGYDNFQLPVRFRDCTVLDKPVMPDEVLAAISNVFAAPVPAKDAD
jgi:DNA-binding response OmpR family regulator